MGIRFVYKSNLGHINFVDRDVDYGDVDRKMDEKARAEATENIKLQMIDEGKIIPERLRVWCYEIYDDDEDEEICTHCYAHMCDCECEYCPECERSSDDCICNEEF